MRNPTTIGSYRILRKIASGGMGDVFLAEDPICHRKVALKRIRIDRKDQAGLQERFLREANIAAKLSHPCIIPIYQIYISDKEVYYTMPLVEGQTLKELLQETKKLEKEENKRHLIGSSIDALMRIFIHVCQAIAYAHAKGVLHKDIKPDNIIIGSYGEVLILDWGLAEIIGEKECAILSEEEVKPELTRPGKIAGTLAYLSLERLSGHKASYASDIYALGVILYQMLTLSLPFHARDLKHYKKCIQQKSIPDPIQRAPYRDIPSQLAQIAKRCLAKHSKQRYESVNALIAEINDYIAGRPQWVPCRSLQIESTKDWMFRENLLLSKHLALTQDVLEWAHFLIAKEHFGENLQIETHVRLHAQSKGIGFVLNVKNKHIKEALLLWIGSTTHPGTHLFRANMELFANPDLVLQEEISCFLKIQKQGSHIQLWINHALVLDYVGNIPLYGPHFGLVLKDDRLDVGTLLISRCSPHIQVHCLTVPDTLVALHHFQDAKEKYLEIASSFEGRLEAKEALYKRGIAILEEASHVKAKAKLWKEALEQFEKLREGISSPLEWLGKSLVYLAMQDSHEEMKCLELALRRFAKHPLLHLVQEHLLFRWHEASYKDRFTTYTLTWMILELLPDVLVTPYNQKLIEHITHHLEPLPFQLEGDSIDLYVQLSFWLDKPMHLLAYLEKKREQEPFIHAALAYLGYKEVHTLDPKRAIKLHQALLHNSSTQDRITQGCLIAREHGLEAAKEFFSLPCEEPFPHTFCLLDHVLHAPKTKKQLWNQGAFFWERVEFYRQCYLLYKAASLPKQAEIARRHLRTLWKQKNKIRINLL